MITTFRLSIMCIIVFMVNVTHTKHASWTGIYGKTYGVKEAVLNRNKKEIAFKKEIIAPFTQLLFSWNIKRPECGYYSFYIQVRDAHTKQWGKWHHMADWGANIQKTYLSRNDDGIASFFHVRLELDEHKKADAFYIRVIAHEKASLEFLRGMFVALSDFNMFKSEEIDDGTYHLKTIHIKEVPSIAQFALNHADKGRICSPTSCAMVAEYIIGKPLPLLTSIEKIFDEGLSAYGSWQCNMAELYNMCDEKISCYVRRANSFIDIYQYLEQKMPVIVSVRGELPGALKPFPHGHLMVVVGWDQQTKQVICHDPAAYSHDEVVKRYPLEAFLRAWERSHRLMYIIEAR